MAVGARRGATPRRRNASRVVRSLSRALDRIEDALAIAVGVLMALLILAIVFDVVGRQVGAVSAPWTVPAAEYFMVYLTFLSAPWILRQNGHVSVEFLAARLGPRRGRVVMRVVLTVALVALCIAFWYSAALVLDDLQRGVGLVSGGIDVPRWLVRIAIPIGFALLAIELCRTIARAAHRPPSGEATS